MSDNPIPSEQPFVSHLIELRDRLMRMVLAVLLIFLGLFPFGNDIYVFVADPLMDVLPEGTSMIATQVASPFLTPFKLAMVTAVFVAMPYLLHQFWAFIAPGLYQHEKRLALPLLASSIVLFYLGAAFAYAVVFPLVFAFLTGVAPEGVAVMTDITHYLDFVLTLFFAFGLAFEVPVATILLVLAGATTPEKLAGKRPFVIVGAFIIGMVLTPPDIISQTLLALPMWLLFEVGLLLSRMLVRHRRQGDDEDAADESADLQAAVAGAAAGAAPPPATPAAAQADRASDPADPADYRPLDEREMEDEMDRIAAEFDALDTPRGDDAQDTTGAAQPENGAGRPRDGSTDWTPADSANMLDEEDFPARTATEALVDAKLQQVAALRETGDHAEARRLLYDVLADGNESQRRVARNILAQLDD